MGGILHRNSAAGNRFVGNVTGSGHFAARSAKPVQVVGAHITQPLQVTGAAVSDHRPAHLMETNVSQVLNTAAKPNLANMAPPGGTTGQ